MATVTVHLTDEKYKRLKLMIKRYGIATILSLALTTFLFPTPRAQLMAQQSNKVVNPSYKHARASWSPVSDLILFDSDIEGSRSIYVIDSKGGNAERITSLNHDDSFGTWSPDGKKILYQSMRGGEYHLLIRDLASGAETGLASSEYVSIIGSWSHDGKRIAYSSRVGERGNNREIFMIDIDGKNQKRLTSNGRIDVLPVFSADDRNIFYQSNRDSEDQRYDIYSVDLETFEIERITDNPANDTDPFIYPFNGQLAFWSGRAHPDGSGLYSINLITKEVARIESTAFSGHPSWSPDGRYSIPVQRGREIYIYDIENARRIQVTDRSKFEGD